MFASATATAASRAWRVRRSVSPCCGVTQPFWTRGLSRSQVTWARSRLAFACCSLRLSEGRLRLRDLMLELRGGDLHEQLPSLNVAADIDVASGDIAARPGVDIRLLECFGGAGPSHHHRAVARTHRRGPYAWDEVAALLCRCHHLRVQPVVLPNADPQCRAQQQERAGGQTLRSAEPPRLG